MAFSEDLQNAGISKRVQDIVPGLSNYPTPAQAAVYLGEYYVDDLYSIDWELSDSTSAVHTYFDDEWVTPIQGKKIVSGTCAINFRYPGYLAHAIDALRKRIPAAAQEEISKAVRDNNDYISDYLKIMTSGSLSDRMRALRDAAAKGRNELRKLSALGLLTIGKIRSGPGPNTKIKYEDVFEAQNPHTNKVIPVDIEIHYGDLDTTHTVDMIRDVVFVGKAKQIQAGAAGAGGTSVSGMNLLEVYSFFAKNVQQIVVPGDPK